MTKAPRRRHRAATGTLVPALLTTIAYVDPGNFGTNIVAGTDHGFALVWVVVLASVSAALIQYLAAKLGLATGRNLASHYAAGLPRVWRLLAWVQAELVVIMTDLAEIVGGALGLYLLFGLPLPLGALLVGLVSFTVLGYQRGEAAHFQIPALALLATVAVCVVTATVRLSPDWNGMLLGVRPAVLDQSALLVAVGIVGATVMPHALYFHSAMSPAVVEESASGATSPRLAALVRHRLMSSIALAMTVAGCVNVLILVLGAATGTSDGTIEGVYAHLSLDGQRWSAILLGVALLASGLASSVIGAWTGQVVMAGFLRRSIPWWVRRLVALAPPVIVLLLGVDAGQALLMSQVVLSLALPLTLAPLIVITSRRTVMGALANGRVLTVLAGAVALAIIALDLALLLPGATR